MRRSTPVVVGIAVIAAGGAAAWWLRDREPTPSRTEDSAILPSTTDGGGRASIAAPRPPVLADAGPGERERPALPAPPTPDDMFTAEPHDAAWAAPTEAEIRKRFARVRGARLEAAACRTTRCKLVIVGPQAELARTIADLEGARGLHGFATNLVLTAPDQRPDGTLELRAYALFTR